MLRRLTAAPAKQNTSRASSFLVFYSATFLRLLEREAFQQPQKRHIQPERYATGS